MKANNSNSNRMSKRFCFICEVHLETDHNVIEHLNKQHKCSWIRQPRAVNGCDYYGQVWYCFKCEDRQRCKTHRSFQSDRAFLSHLQNNHNDEYYSRISRNTTMQLKNIK